MRVPPDLRASLFKGLRNQGIWVQVNYLPAFRHPVFKNMEIETGAYPVSNMFYSREISFPMFASLSEAQLDKVVSTFKELIA